MMNLWKNAAWIIPTASECDDMDKCRIAYDHSTCSYGQPVVLLERATSELAADTPFGPADCRGGLIQHNGPHTAALESAGWRVVKELKETLANERLLFGVHPAYLDELPSAAD